MRNRVEQTDMTIDLLHLLQAVDSCFSAQWCDPGKHMGYPRELVCCGQTLLLSNQPSRCSYGTTEWVL